MIGLLRLFLTGLAAVALAAATLSVATAQDSPRRAPKMRSIPFVSITRSDGTTRYFETNAIPLLPDKACFGWRAWLGGPDRTVSMVEILQTSAPARDIIAGPETEVSPDKTRSTTRMRERVVDGYMMRSWCIDSGDPPGTYTYHLTIDGEPRGEFVFCAIEMKEQDEDIDPTELSCPNKFQSVERDPSSGSAGFQPALARSARSAGLRPAHDAGGTPALRVKTCAGWKPALPRAYPS